MRDGVRKNKRREEERNKKPERREIAR